MEGYGLHINTVRKYMPDRVKSPGSNWKHGTQRADYHLPLLGFQMKKNEQEETSQTQSQTAVNLGIPFGPALIPVCANLQSATLEL
jgi:hypothetical protein